MSNAIFYVPECVFTKKKVLHVSHVKSCIQSYHQNFEGYWDVLRNSGLGIGACNEFTRQGANIHVMLCGETISTFFAAIMNVILRQNIGPVSPMRPTSGPSAIVCMGGQN